MSGLRRLAVAALTALLVVGLAGSPASAQTKTRKDKVGDAPANVDIRSAKVQNNQKNYALTVRFTKVQKRHTLAGAFLFPGTVDTIDEIETFYVVGSIPVSGGRYSTQLYRYSLDESAADDGEQRVSCPGLTSEWKRGSRGFARIVVPQACLGADAGTLVTGVLAADKQDDGMRSVLRSAARRGDEGGDLGIGADSLASPITTRRG